MPKMTPAQEAAYALDFNVSRDDLKPEVWAEYDRLWEARREAAHALESSVSRDDLKPEVRAEYDRLLKARRACSPAIRSGLTVDDAQGTVTIWQGGRAVLSADDHGVTVRRPLARPRRVAWAEVSRFEDGGGYDSQSGGYIWHLIIVLRAGQRVGAYPTHGAPAPETVAAVRQLAERYGIRADVAGVPMKDGKPVRRGLYHDPGRQAGLRYWDGDQWSPLLPPDIVRPRRLTLQESPASWSALPTADGRWTYPVTRAARLRVWSAVFAGASAALVAGGVLVELYGHVNHNNDPSFWLFFLGVILAVWALRAFMSRRFLLKLDEAAKGAPGSWA